MFLKIVEILATIGTLTGFWMVSENITEGFAVSLAANLLWMLWAHEKDSLGILIVNFALAIAALNGLEII